MRSSNNAHLGHEEKMVLSGSDCSCVLVPDQSELESACSTTTYPDILQKLNDMRAHEEACDVFFIVGREKKVSSLFLFLRLYYGFFRFFLSITVLFLLLYDCSGPLNVCIIG